MTTPTLPHWIDGAERVSTSGRTAPVFNPATGEVSANVGLADEAEIAEALRSAQRGFELWSGFSVAKRQNVLFSFRELLNSRKRELAEIITAEHGKVVSDAMGEILRGQEVVELATGFPSTSSRATSASRSRPASTSTRLKSAARRRRHHQPLQLPRHGADVVLPHRHRGRQHGRPEAQRRKTPRLSIFLAEALQGGGPPGRRLHRPPGRQDSLSTACLNSPRRRESISFVGSTPIAQVHLRDRVEERQARPGPRGRQEPHARPPRRRHGARRRLRPSTRASARPVSAAWRSACSCSPSSDVGDKVIPMIKERIVEASPSATARATRPASPTWARSITERSTATRSPRYVDIAIEADGADHRRRRPWHRRSTAPRGRLLVRPDPHRPQVPLTSARRTPKRSSARCSAVVRVDTLRRGRRADQLRCVRQRHRDLHQRRRRRASLPE